jgi:hypothetical protein
VENGEDSQSPGLLWNKAINDQATDEVNAHINMFLSKQNPAFFDLLSEACAVLVRSIDKGWYNSSAEPSETDQSKQSDAKIKKDEDFMDADDVVVVD